ncbi:MAG: hypothetical protein ABID84_02525 [Chloroflexota bacterium]
MTSQPTREPLGDYLGREAVNRVVEKSPFGGYQVRYLPFLWTVGHWVFLKGVVLGRAFCDRVGVVARLLALEGEETQMVRGLGEIAPKMVEAYGRMPDSFLDFFLKTAAPQGYDYSDMRTLKRLHNQKVRLGEMLPWLQLWCYEGIGFGVTYPDQVEELWKANYETADHQEWQQARAAGLDLPEHLETLTLDEMECAVVEETLEYLRMYFPDLSTNEGGL